MSQEGPTKLQKTFKRFLKVNALYESVKVVFIFNRIKTKLPFSSGLFSPKEGQLVLAGDPKQLGPILRSPLALQYGLGETADSRVLLFTNAPAFHRHDSSFHLCSQFGFEGFSSFG